MRELFTFCAAILAGAGLSVAAMLLPIVLADLIGWARQLPARLAQARAYGARHGSDTPTVPLPTAPIGGPSWT